MVRMMGLLAEAKERQKQKISRQFISFYDSVLYLGEPKNEALEFVINNLRNEQTHLRLEYGELYLINIQRYQDDPDEYNYFTDDFISDHLTECVKAGHIDDNNPIYNLGFAKKSFIEMLVCFGLPVSESEQRTVQSPDLAFNDEYFEVDYYTYEMIVNERDELRERLENQQTQTDSQLSQQVAELQSQLISAGDTIKRQAEKIADLKAQLEQQAGNQSDTATDDEILNYDEVKAIQAIKNEFWLDYDPKNKPVLKLVVTEWITQNYPSINPSMASWLDKIVRQKYVK